MAIDATSQKFKMTFAGAPRNASEETVRTESTTTDADGDFQSFGLAEPGSPRHIASGRSRTPPHRLHTTRAGVCRKSGFRVIDCRISEA
jgi:hypothetical protein